MYKKIISFIFCFINVCVASEPKAIEENQYPLVYLVYKAVDENGLVVSNKSFDYNNYAIFTEEFMNKYKLQKYQMQRTILGNTKTLTNIALAIIKEDEEVLKLLRLYVKSDTIDQENLRDYFYY